MTIEGSFRTWLAVSTRARGTGFRCDAVVFDDRLDIKRTPTPNDVEECRLRQPHLRRVLCHGCFGLGVAHETQPQQ
jgi:hypothetical protein